MAKKISELAAAAALTGAELVELVQAGANVQALLGALLPLGYIDGGKVTWVGPNAITVGSCSAYIPGLGRVVRSNSDIAKAGLVLVASTWYHVYLYLNAGTPDVEIATVAPGAPYYGTARAKTGDTMRRYLFSFRTDSSGNILRFAQNGLRVSYYTDIANAGNRVLSAGIATSLTTVSAASFVPVSSKLAQIRFQNSDTSSPSRFTNSETGQVPSAALLTIPPGNNGTAFVDFPLNSAQEFQYFMGGPTSTPGGCFADVLGYIYER